MAEKIFCEEMIKPELSEDTLAHYGVKGMKWRKRKAKGKKKSNNLSNTRRQMSNARTNDEREALAVSTLHQLGEKNWRRLPNRGTTPAQTEQIVSYLKKKRKKK